MTAFKGIGWVLKQVFMISCKKASELISKSMDEPLSVPEQITLKMHLFLCEFCEQFRKQLELLSEGTKRLFGVTDASKCLDDESVTLSPDAKKKILERLKNPDGQ